MSIRATAHRIDSAAGELVEKGPGFMGRRERRVEANIGEFVDEAFCVPAGGVLPPDVLEEVRKHIDHTIDLLEVHIARSGHRSPKTARQHVGLARQIYALREVEQHLSQTRCWHRH